MRSRIDTSALLLALTTLLIPFHADALQSDREQPLQVEADRANIDNKNGISIYLGNVIVVQGSMRITADKLTVYARDQILTKMISEGNPTTYKQRPEGKEQDVKGRGQRIEYYEDTETAIFIERAVLEQDGNTFNSDRIVYDVARDKVNAGTTSSGDRVRIILQPKENPDRK